MKRIVLITSLMLSLIKVSVGQDQTSLIEWDKKRPLVWEDFKGIPNDNAPFQAYTCGTIKFNYEKLSDNQFKFVMKVGFVPEKSWAKSAKLTDNLLIHEQIHFNIHELYSRILIQRLEESKALSGKNFSEKVNGIFQKVFKELSAFQEKYDKETDHSKNEDKQKEWTNKIDKMLKEYQKFAKREIVFKI